MKTLLSLCILLGFSTCACAQEPTHFYRIPVNHSDAYVLALLLGQSRVIPVPITIPGFGGPLSNVVSSGFGKSPVPIVTTIPNQVQYNQGVTYERKPN